MLAPALKGTIFAEHIHHYYKIGSTNTQAMEAAAAGAPAGSVFLAEEQTAGRGRGAHRWYSARSLGIHCSVILRPSLPPSEVLILSLAVGLAVHDAVREIDSRVEADLKWPNDLLIEGKKFCGILTEMNGEATRVRNRALPCGASARALRLRVDQTRRTAGFAWTDRLGDSPSVSKCHSRRHRCVTAGRVPQGRGRRVLGRNPSGMLFPRVMALEQIGTRAGSPAIAARQARCGYGSCPTLAVAMVRRWA